MNPIEVLTSAVQELLPDVEPDLVKPRDPSGRWALGLTYSGWYASMFWIHGKGFGYSIGPVDDDTMFGRGQDVLIPDTNPATFAKFVVSALRTRLNTYIQHIG